MPPTLHGFPPIRVRLYPGPAPRQAAAPESSRDIWITLGALSAAIGIGLLFAVLHGGDGSPTALLWALACLAAGALVGFLFGIPRVLQQEERAGASREGGAPEGSNTYQIRVNTNLEQVSDWLTKILVGIGLVQLQTFPEKVSRGAAFIAGGLDGVQGPQQFAAALIVYFTIVGFIGGYVMTRLFLTGAFARADKDAGAFARADTAGLAELRSTRIGLPNESAGLRGKAAQAAQQIQHMEVHQLRDPDDLALWAKAKFYEGEYELASTGFRRAMEVVPENPRLRAEYAAAIFYATRDAEEVRDQLLEARRLLRAQTARDADLQQYIYVLLTYVSLYMPPPDGFRDAIRFAKEYAGEGGAPNASILINLASAYGQQARWLSERGGAPGEIEQIRGEALQAVKEALEARPQGSKRILQGLLDEAYRDSPEDDDLSLFAEDPEFRAVLGLPPAPAGARA